MLSAYRRSVASVVAANGPLKPRLFSTSITLRNEESPGSKTGIERRRVFDTVRIDGTSTANTGPYIESIRRPRVFDTVRIDGTSTANAGPYVEKTLMRQQTSLSNDESLRKERREKRSAAKEEAKRIIGKYQESYADFVGGKRPQNERDETSAVGVEASQNEQAMSRPSKYPHISLKHVTKDTRRDFAVSGFIGAPRKVGKLLFVPLTRDGATLQLICSASESPEAHEAFTKSITVNSAVEIVGCIQEKRARPLKDGEVAKQLQPWEEVEIVVKHVKTLAKFPDDIVVGEVAKYGPEQRHLQIRFDEGLANRLRFRSAMTQKVHEQLADFTQVDTPILFKSTPEGAREFLVPTRDAGKAYALPQSPQQYKQILMASGIDKYYQMAHCFRDEDLRADRQPEFMQLDMEMAFARGADVRKRVEYLVKMLWKEACEIGRSHNIQVEPLPHHKFHLMTYNVAMATHGVDKPDLRIKDEIHEVQVPDGLQKMMTSLKKPIFETFKFNLSATPSEVRAFIGSLMDSPEFRTFNTNSDGPPGVFIYDPSAPLSGLHAFGHEGVESIRSQFEQHQVKKLTHEKGQAAMTLKNRTSYRNQRLEKWEEELRDNKSDTIEKKTERMMLLEESIKSWADKLAAITAELEEFRADTEVFQPGDVIIMQARKEGPFQGGSTSLGRLRTLIHKAAVEKGYMTMPKGFQPLWVVDFPLFTPNNDTDPGQGGSSGFSATHHPFTNPRSPHDVRMCAVAPLKARADHYDLVINGVELGGGSGRIHSAEMQEFVLRKVLGMHQERVEDFRHLLEALRAGCPPHAGLALGWDRLVAMWCGRESIRDVLAFPKDGKGRDPMVKSPTRMEKRQLDTYHLSLGDVEKKKWPAVKKGQDANGAVRKVKSSGPAKTKKKTRARPVQADVQGGSSTVE